MLLFYVRHGDPTYNPDDLTPLGERQAEALAKRFAIYGLDEIYTSPLNRARKTAQPTCELLKKTPVVLDWTSEDLARPLLTFEVEPGKRKWACAYPPMRELFLSPEVRALGGRWYTHPAFKETRLAEAVETVDRETDKFMLSLGYRHDRDRCGYVPEAPSEKRIAIFAHAGFGGIFLSSLLDIPYNEFSARMKFSHTGVTAIQFVEEEGFCIPKVLQFSNDSHLYREGLGTKHSNKVPI